MGFVLELLELVVVVVVVVVDGDWYVVEVAVVIVVTGVVVGGGPVTTASLYLVLMSLDPKVGCCCFPLVFCRCCCCCLGSDCCCPCPEILCLLGCATVGVGVVVVDTNLTLFTFPDLTSSNVVAVHSGFWFSSPVFIAGPSSPPLAAKIGTLGAPHSWHLLRFSGPGGRDPISTLSLTAL